MNDFYCSQKFWWLTLDVEKRSVSSCCAATPEKIDLTWLKHNPGQLFNIPEFIADRKNMLDGVPVASCENNCWRPEHNGLVSRRLSSNSNIVTHTSINSSPEELGIMLGTDCNLTCSYCCKQHSTAWLRDIVNNGPYLDEPRQIINSNDRIVMQLGQKAIQESSVYQKIIDELAHFKEIKNIDITGGEPLLYNKLPELVSKLSGSVTIHTGLGINISRLNRIIDQLPSSVKFIVSAENTGKLYEFNRYGNTWDRFRTNLDVISKKFKYSFSSVISNVTIHGLEEFRKEFVTDSDIVNYCNDPEYLALNVLDPISKEKYNIDNNTTQMLSLDYTPGQKQKFQTYITGFAQRRGLDISIFPEHFVSWINERN